MNSALIEVLFVLSERLNYASFSALKMSSKSLHAEASKAEKRNIHWMYILENTLGINIPKDMVYNSWRSVYNSVKTKEALVFHPSPFIVHLGLMNGVDPSANNNYAIRVASQTGNVKVVKMLMNVKGVDPGAHNNQAIGLACSEGHIDVVKALLASDLVDPSADDNYAIKRACENGHSKVVKLLLGLHKTGSRKSFYGKIDPSSENNYAIRMACKNGHLQVVKLLLEDGRVNPFTDNSYPIKIASENGRTDVVRLLLQHNKFVISGDHGYTLKLAAANGHLEIVKLLMDAGKYTDNFLTISLMEASNRGHEDVVYFLLERLKLYESGTLILDVMVYYGCTIAAKILLEDEDVVPSANLLKIAARKGYSEIVLMLLNDGRFDPSMNNNYALRWARDNKHFDVVALLLEYERVQKSMSCSSNISIDMFHESAPVFKN